MSEAKFEPGEGSRSIKKKEPLTRFLASLETTLSHKGRGCTEFAARGFCYSSPCTLGIACVGAIDGAGFDSGASTLAA